MENWDWVKILSGVSAVASILSNIIPAHTIVGKLLNVIAGNWNKRAIASDLPELKNGILRPQ